jgi:hypothetical protein
MLDTTNDEEAKQALVFALVKFFRPRQIFLKRRESMQACRAPFVIGSSPCWQLLDQVEKLSSSFSLIISDEKKSFK